MMFSPPKSKFQNTLSLAALPIMLASLVACNNNGTASSNTATSTTAQEITKARGEAQSSETQENTPSTDELFQNLLNDHWAFVMEQNPTFATSQGVRDYDNRLGSYSLASYDKEIIATKGFLDRLKTIDVNNLNKDNQINYRLFKIDMETTLRGADFGGKYLLMTNRSGPHLAVTGLPDNLPFFTKNDYESYLARLNDIDRLLGEAEETLLAGVKAGWTQPCEPMTKMAASIKYHLVDDPADSTLMKPFKTKPDSIDQSTWDDYKARALQSVKDTFLPALNSYADFYDNDYAPNCRQEIGASTLPQGTNYYQYRVKNFTTTDRTPDQIHQIGLSEVARIRGEMDDIIKSVGFEGSFKEFQTFLREDERFYAKTEEELVSITSTISKRIDGELPRLFTQLPRMPYTVKPVPADIAEGTTTAYYERPAGDGSRAGIYRINTSLLDQRPIFELEALSLHEAVPGHHFQIALSQELSLPPFRAFGGFTAFVEGWGLYAESLGLDVGFYQDPYQNFGRLSYEMWRACRLVVDTGMHAKGWSRQQAIDYMADNTALSLHNISSEVDRYITWPGQALAYKTGQLKIKELRERAASQLGDKFDLRLFHDAVLENGAVPLSVLEENIDAFIQKHSQ